MKRRSLIAIGLTVIAALVLVVRALVFLHPSPGNGETKLTVRFQDVDKIAPGTRVTFAGKPIGEVTSVRLLQESFDDRSTTSRAIYPYEVMLAIDSSVRVYTSDEISIKTAGLMGEHFVAIIPRAPHEGVELTLVNPTDVIFARSGGGAEETMQQIASVAEKADQTMEAMISLINRNQEGIYQTTEAIRASSRELELLLFTLNEGNFGQKLVAVSDKSLACLNKIEQVSQLAQRVVQGEGTLGKLATDPRLYYSFLEASARTNQLVTDINTYGVLFHTNRDWQREACRRSEQPPIIAAADQELQERFEKISQAVSELQQKVTKAEACLRGAPEPKEELFRRFSDMKQQIADLQESLTGTSSDSSGEEDGEPST
jgi:phospholipid/cholesterol/gamma-HCH transport system substrate-binding protein